MNDKSFDGTAVCAESPAFLQARWPTWTIVLHAGAEVLAEWVYEKVDHTSSDRVDHTLVKLDVL